MNDFDQSTRDARHMAMMSNASIMGTPIVEQPKPQSTTPASVSPVRLEDEIVSEHYFIASDALHLARAVHVAKDASWKLGKTQALTICILQLRNGFTLTGESACVSFQTFDAEIGRRIARENAIEKLWPLLGFRLADALNG